MKRFFALILAVTMMLALVACGNSAQAESASEDEIQTSNSTNVQPERFICWQLIGVWY